jgi:hypothetical protein
MTNDPREDFDSSVEGAEREALLSLARQLHEERPLPSAGFRSAVRNGHGIRRLRSAAPRHRGDRPGRRRAVRRGLTLGRFLLL